MALQAGKGRVDGRHYLPSTPETVLWGRLPGCGTPPVLAVEPESTITVDTVSHEGILEDQGRDPVAFFARYGVPPGEVLEDARSIAACVPHTFGVDGPHVVTGPVLVRGAEPGDVLRVETLSLHPRAGYGLVSARHGRGALPGELPEGPPPEPDADARRWEGFRTTTTFCVVERRRGRLTGVLTFGGGRQARFPLAPSMGVLAVGVDSPEPVHSTPPGRHGGNLDVRDLVAGSRLYLPVQVPGALFSVGDPHYAQGNGEVALTALEAPLRATFRLTVLRGPAARAAVGLLAEPFAETDTHWIPLGLHTDLDEAMRRAVRAAVRFLETRVGMDRASAYAYLSVAGDFAVSQVVDGVQGVHCLIRRSDFGPLPAPQPPPVPQVPLLQRVPGRNETRS
ncbi:MAG TPA: acetamidase/formamidase family protein [Frankiaceae bacterium]|nr:acetamidase/formamidase family protein [Frankiaceae bacterium]